MGFACYCKFDALNPLRFCGSGGGGGLVEREGGGGGGGFRRFPEPVLLATDVAGEVARSPNDRSGLDVPKL